MASAGLEGQRRQRRWIAGAVVIFLVAAASYVVPRLGTRSPLAIVIVCAMAILVMKLVEHRVHRWFRRWEQWSANRPEGSRAKGQRRTPRA